MSERRKISVVVADDHPIVLAGFATMIRTSPEFEVVGEFRNGQDLLDGVIQLQPQIAVIDRVMPGLAGPEVMASLRRIGLKTRVVLISATFSADEIRSAASLGAAGSCERMRRRRISSAA